jgi:tRNA-Thr(GGU) m(6)t(6)A37 methyltransferase TsaA
MVLTSIGTVHSPWREAAGTPVQSFSAWKEGGGWPGGPEDGEASPFADRRGGRGTLELLPAWEEALADLDGYSHLWVFFWLDRSRPATTKVLPYRDTVERGLFSTRAPARPNPIGMSCLRLLAVRGRFVHVTGLDILDGTPLLDLKPYVPDYDAFPDARRGWLEAPTVQTGTVHADARFLRSEGSAQQTS